MSSLWKCICNRIIRQKRPSPTKCNHTLYIAQNVYVFIFAYIKRISLSASLRGKVNASMTVEAAIVLPLFLFFFLNLGSTIEMMRLHGNLELALWETGSRLSVYGHVIGGNDPEDSEREDSFWTELSGVALSYTYVKAQLVEYLGEEYLEESPLTYGVDGLQFLESDIWETDGKFELMVTYSVSPLSSISGFRSFRMANRYYGHLWNGYYIPGTSDEETVQQVYITETGQVYHTNTSCTHLKLSVKQVSRQEALVSRNEQGGRYTPCEKCEKFGVTTTVYITNEGDRYHFERDCPGLKRTIYCVPISEVVGRRLCQRCSAAEEK